MADALYNEGNNQTMSKSDISTVGIKHCAEIFMLLVQLNHDLLTCTRMEQIVPELNYSYKKLSFVQWEHPKLLFVQWDHPKLSFVQWHNPKLLFADDLPKPIKDIT